MGAAVPAIRYFSRWHAWLPLVAAILLGFTWGHKHLPALVYLLVAAVLGAVVICAVHHAEVIAAKVGEPFGSIILAVAVTLIEVGLIIMLMQHGGETVSTLARDTIFAAAMLTLNGITGIAIVVATRRGSVGMVNSEGGRTALASVALLAVLTLVLPRFTVSDPSPQFTPAQAAFAAVMALIIYFSFLITQTTRHRDFFLPIALDGSYIKNKNNHSPSTKTTAASAGLLLLALISVVGLAKVMSPGLERVVAAAGLPESFTGVIIAMLVLMPECLAAAKAARRGKLMDSFNLGYGSAMASIGLTIPAVILVAWLTGLQLTLGLGSLQLVLLATTIALSVLTLGGRRVTRQQGVLHLVLGGAFIFLAMVP